MTSTTNPYKVPQAPTPGDSEEWGRYIIELAASGGDWARPPVITADHEQALNTILALVRAGISLVGQPDDFTRDRTGQALTAVTWLEVAIFGGEVDRALWPKSLTEARLGMALLASIAAADVVKTHPGQERALLDDLREYYLSFPDEGDNQ